MKKLTFLLLFLVGCSVSPFRQQSVDSTEELRDQSTALMAKAVKPFDDHRDSVGALQARLYSQLAAEGAREDNDESVAQ